MRAQTFSCLPLFLVLNGVLFRHGERRCATEGRTKLIENLRGAFIERLPVSRHICGNGPEQSHSSMEFPTSAEGRPLADRGSKLPSRQSKRCSCQYTESNNYGLRSEGFRQTGLGWPDLATSILNGSYPAFSRTVAVLAPVIIPYDHWFRRHSIKHSVVCTVPCPSRLFWPSVSVSTHLLWGVPKIRRLTSSD